MTREEAIADIRDNIKPIVGGISLDMAIEVLEQKTCEDCISRQAVLDINEHHHGQMPNHVNHEIWNEINALPSVTPKEKTGWIPVKYRDMTQEEIERYSEYTEVTKVFDCKMPDDGQDILVSTRSGIVTTDVCDIDDMYGYGLEDYGDWEDIVAWMPLPEPYEPQESEKI